MERRQDTENPTGTARAENPARKKATEKVLSNLKELLKVVDAHDAYRRMLAAGSARGGLPLPRGKRRVFGLRANDKLYKAAFCSVFTLVAMVLSWSPPFYSLTANTSISMRTSFGSLLTSTVALAGYGLLK